MPGRRLFDHLLVVTQVLPVNPAAAVRGPKPVVTKGATPVLSPAEARRLIEAIDTGTLAGRRDRALVSVMLYSFPRVSAVIGMRRQDYFRQESRGWLRLHEKGGKRHDVPAHHRAAEALDDYLELAGLDEAKAALFQSVDPAGRRLTGRALSRRLVLAMIKRRAAGADLPESTCCRARVAEDDEALRPDNRRDQRRRDRAHRDLVQECPRRWTGPLRQIPSPGDRSARVTRRTGRGVGAGRWRLRAPRGVRPCDS